MPVNVTERASPPKTLSSDGEPFTIPLAVGDRVEVEVNVIADPNWQYPFIRDNFESIEWRLLGSGPISEVKDLFGNIIGQSATRTRTIKDTVTKLSLTVTESAQKNPWRFAFIAAGSGDYVLRVKGLDRGPFRTANLKAAVHGR